MGREFTDEIAKVASANGIKELTLAIGSNRPLISGQAMQKKGMAGSQDYMQFRY